MKEKTKKNYTESKNQLCWEKTEQTVSGLMSFGKEH